MLDGLILGIDPASLALAVLLGYLLGCISPAYTIARMKHRDIKQAGNGNAGASNVTMQFGPAMGALTAAIDILKAAAAFRLAVILFPAADTVSATAGNIGIVAANAAVLGHIFPFYLKFNGGKGFASYIGLSLCVSPIFTIGILAGSLVFTALTGYIICSTFSLIIALPLFLWLGLNDAQAAIGVGAISCIVAIRHAENLARIKNGTEPKIQDVFRKIAQKKKRS